MKNFLLSRPVRNIFLLWLAWALILLAFQFVARARFDVRRPDNILPWTTAETDTEKRPGQPYLNDPVMNYQVAYDSEFYLSIAIAGYDDPILRTAPPEWRPDLAGHAPVSLNYAFFPFYPLAIRVLDSPLSLLGLSQIGTAALAGVIVSLLGTLGAMLALYDLTRDELQDSGGLRTAFYLIAFPTGFFLAMVHTEGLFVGLAFGSLAFLRRKYWIPAAILAACAVWTRAVGVALVIPLAVAWITELRSGGFSLKPFPWMLFGKALLACAPLAAFGIWRLTLGANFDFVEMSYFGRGPLQPSSLQGWQEAFNVLVQGGKYVPSENVAWSFTGGVTLQNRLYYGIEFLVTIFATIACLLTMRRNPGLSLFGLGVLVISFFSGNAYGSQGMPRYALAVPSMFMVLGSWGRSELFDRIWTLASVLLMGLLAIVFSFNFWVG
jgi:hypothetical protein